MDSYLITLEDEVILKNNVVTFTWLVKNLKVSPNIVKQMLYEFVEKQRAANVNVNVTYLISGDRNLDDGTLAHEVHIIPESSLSSEKSKFAVITSIHIYAVHKAPLQDPSVLYSSGYHSNHAQDTEESCKGLAISCPTLTFRTTTNSIIEVKNEPQIISPNLQQTMETTETKTDDKTQTSDKPHARANGVLDKMFSNMNKKTTKQQTTTRPIKVEEKPKLNEKSKVEKSENKKPSSLKRKVPTKSDELKTTVVKSESSNVKKRRRIVVMSDSSDEENESDAEDASDRLIRIPVNDNPEDPLPPPSPKPEPIIETDQTQTRHKRSLIEETQLDKDGYLVTNKFWKNETEIVKENKPLPSERLKTKPVTTETKPAPRSKQSSLMSFFTKK